MSKSTWSPVNVLLVLRSQKVFPCHQIYQKISAFLFSDFLPAFFHFLSPPIPSGPENLLTNNIEASSSVSKKYFCTNRVYLNIIRKTDNLFVTNQVLRFYEVVEVTLRRRGSPGWDQKYQQLKFNSKCKYR